VGRAAHVVHVNAPAPHFYSDLLIAANRAAKKLAPNASVFLHVEGDESNPGVWRAALSYERFACDHDAKKHEARGASPREAVAGAVVAFFVAICNVADTHAEAATALRETVTPFLTPENTGT
jgi:hypothetical protein